MNKFMSIGILMALHESINSRTPEYVARQADAQLLQIVLNNPNPELCRHAIARSYPVTSLFGISAQRRLLKNLHTQLSKLRTVFSRIKHYQSAEYEDIHEALVSNIDTVRRMVKLLGE